MWHTPGGGIDPGESPQHAACRELAEEVGLALAEPNALGPVVWTRRFQFLFDGVQYDQDEVFYLLRDGITGDVQLRVEMIEPELREKSVALPEQNRVANAMEIRTSMEKWSQLVREAIDVAKASKPR